MKIASKSPVFKDSEKSKCKKKRQKTDILSKREIRFSLLSTEHRTTPAAAPVLGILLLETRHQTHVVSMWNVEWH